MVNQLNQIWRLPYEGHLRFPIEQTAATQLQQELATQDFHIYKRNLITYHITTTTANYEALTQACDQTATVIEQNLLYALTHTSPYIRQWAKLIVNDTPHF